MSLTSCQSRPAIDAAIYRPNGTLYQLQPSFHPHSTEPEPTARARRAGKEFYQTTPEFMFVFILLLVVDYIQSASATVSMIMYSVRAARNGDFATTRLYKECPKTWTREYQRRHHPDGPQRRCSIHNRPTWSFSADDGAYAGHWKGPRPVSYEINSRFRRFGYGTGQITGLNVYYI